MATTSRLEPDAPFSLEASAEFGFGPNTGRPKPDDGQMRLAFVADDMRHYAAVHVEQSESGAVQVTVQGDAHPESVVAQIARILCLDHPAAGWLALGARDPVLGRLQASHPGFRPVLFHSPYEAAAWSIISTRRHRTQATATRTRLAVELGRTFKVARERVHAFPLPERLRDLESFPGLDERRIFRLRAVASAALEGALNASRLSSLAAPAALAELQRLPGIGSTYSTLILLRATGVADVLTLTEPRLAAYVGHLYETEPNPPTEPQIEAIAERWRPFRTWATVLIRLAGDRLGLPEGRSA